MKPLLLFTCILALLSYNGAAQSKSSTPDAVVWGSVQNNFPGGQEAYNTWLADSLVYPSVALENHVMGCTYVRFTIEKNGSLSDVRVYRGVGSGMDEAAVRFLRNGRKWIPNMLNGQPVRTRCKAAVSYILKENDKHELVGTVTGVATNPTLLTGTDYQ